MVAVAAELLAAHGGHLSVSGGRMELLVPIVGEELVTNARILVVDDDEESRALVRVALERESFSVLEAGDGAEALEVIATEHPDLVVLDVNLPSMGGFDVLAQMRLVHSVPVIMVTGRDGETDRVLGLELGADDYVVKPFAPRELTSACARSCAARRRRAARSTSTSSGSTSISPAAR